MNIKLKRLSCRRCGHKWIPRQREIKMCPNCKSTYWNKRVYGLQQIANNKMHAALYRGDLVRPQTCEKCGVETFTVGHHPDYNKPLDVKWLCNSCHIAEHKLKRESNQ